MKTQDITIEEFEETVKTTLGNIYNAIPEADATKIVKDSYTEHAKYSVQSAISFTKKRLQKAKADEEATDIKGIVFGAREVAGESGKGPTIFGLLTGRTGIEIQSWYGEVDTGDKKIRIPQNAIVQMKIAPEEYNDRKTWWAKNVIGRKPMTKEEIIEKISKIVVDIDDVKKIVKNFNPMQVVAMKCSIAGVNAMKKFGSDDQLPIWHKQTKDDKLIGEGPQASIRTRKSKNDTMAWIRINPSKMGTGITVVEIEDFNEICQEVTERFDNPLDQAQFLGNAMEDREIIAIGSISKIGGDSENGYQINMNALALIESSIMPEPIVQGQTKLPETKTPEVKTEEVEKPTEDAPLLDEAETPKEETPKEEAPNEIVEEIKRKLLFAASTIRKIKSTASREEKIAALKTLSKTDLKNIKMIGKYPEAVVMAVYETLTGSEPV